MFLVAPDTETTCQAVLGEVRCVTRETGVDWDVLKPEPIIIRPPPRQPMRQWYRRQPSETPPTGKAVGKLLSNGDCDGAISVALEAGDVALANEAKKFCTGQDTNQGDQ